jgi:hypothetical protein
LPEARVAAIISRMADMRCVVVREHGGVDRLLLEERAAVMPVVGSVRRRWLMILECG